MALLAIAIYDPEEANRSEITKDCLHSLFQTVSPKHRIFLIDNASCDRTKAIIQDCAYYPNLTIITNEKNLGTAEAINLAWKHREPGEFCMKIDNDVIWHQSGWVDLMEEAMRRDPSIGILGAKRKDCCETTWHEDPQYRSELKMLPHIAGEKWILVEKVHHVMGTCQMYNSALLDKIGYLYQPGLYGFDDVLASYRSQVAGFYNAHLSAIEIDHIDPGGTPFQTWKEKVASQQFPEIHQIVDAYLNGNKSIYYNPYQ